MVRVRKKEGLNETVSKMVLEAPMIAKKAQPGQFVIVRAKEESERIPLTIADYDRKEGTVTIIYQIVGAGTMELDTVREGEYVQDLVGPLGKASETEGLHKVAVVGGGRLRHRIPAGEKAAWAGCRGTLGGRIPEP